MVHYSKDLQSGKKNYQTNTNQGGTARKLHSEMYFDK